MNRQGNPRLCRYAAIPMKDAKVPLRGIFCRDRFFSFGIGGGRTPPIPNLNSRERGDRQPLCLAKFYAFLSLQDLDAVDRDQRRCPEVYIHRANRTIK